MKSAKQKERKREGRGEKIECKAERKWGIVFRQKKRRKYSVGRPTISLLLALVLVAQLLVHLLHKQKVMVESPVVVRLVFPQAFPILPFQPLIETGICPAK